MTVMFCDLVDSTALSEQLDPEELREVVRAYHETCAGVIGRYAGHTAQHLGDGLLVYFGHPAAHEDDAQRAVRTGLEIIAGLQSLNAQLLPASKGRLPHLIQVRIGIHTGVVVIGEIGSSDKREVLALGETPNIAARLQGLAEPDTVVISAATHRLVQGFFSCQALGAPTLKGISTPVPVYRALGESGVQSRFEVAVRTGLTPLVGRDEEMGVLLRRWEKVKEGEGQIVLLSGEAGIGKSRLMQELKERVAREGYTRIEFRCSPYYQNTAWYPVIDHLEAHFALEVTSYLLGEFIKARTHFEQSVALYDPQKHQSHAFLYGQDPGIGCRAVAGSLLWSLGYPDQALERTREALTLEQDLAHPFSFAFALVFAGGHSWRTRDVQTAEEQIQAAIKLSTEHGFSFYVVAGKIMQGWPLAERGHEGDAIAQMRQGLTAWRSLGAAAYQTHYLAMLAEVHGKVEQAEEGLSVLAEALAIVDRTGERYYEAELHRLKGQLTLQKFQVSGSKFQVASPQRPTPSTQAEAEAEACFLKAIEVARRQQAKSLELRAVMSLSRLWQQQGKKDEARQMLTEIYGWFTEGFDAKDLQEAKALLTALSE